MVVHVVEGEVVKKVKIQTQQTVRLTAGVHAKFKLYSELTGHKIAFLVDRACGEWMAHTGDSKIETMTGDQRDQSSTPSNALMIDDIATTVANAC